MQPPTRILKLGAGAGMRRPEHGEIEDMEGRFRITRLLGLGLAVEAVLAAAAIYAGISMLAAPDGSGMQMPVSWLDGTPFADYFVPGLVLLTVNGLLPLAVILFAFVGYRHACTAMMLSGVLLLGWLTIQLALLRMVHPVMHPTLYAAGLALVAIGYVSWLRAGRPGFGPLRLAV